MCSCQYKRRKVGESLMPLPSRKRPCTVLVVSFNGHFAACVLRLKLNAVCVCSFQSSHTSFVFFSFKC